MIMQKFNYEKTLKKVLSQKKTCEKCGCKETRYNILLKWDEKWLCDDCALSIYGKEE